jgi:phage shock protein PspC (stress-responsive transcriptional regulator)
MPEVTEDRPPWTRAREGRILFGVCAGFAARMGVKPWLVRGVMVVAGIVTAGLATVVYLLLALLLPVEPLSASGDDSP